jgi:hypothetical protein
MGGSWGALETFEPVYIFALRGLGCTYSGIWRWGFSARYPHGIIQRFRFDLFTHKLYPFSSYGTLPSSMSSNIPGVHVERLLYSKYGSPVVLEEHQAVHTYFVTTTHTIGLSVSRCLHPLWFLGAPGRVWAVAIWIAAAPVYGH